MKEQLKKIATFKHEIKGEKLMLDNPNKYDTIQEALAELDKELVTCPECNELVQIKDTYANVCIDCFDKLYNYKMA